MAVETEGGTQETTSGSAPSDSLDHSDAPSRTRVSRPRNLVRALLWLLSHTRRSICRAEVDAVNEPPEPWWSRRLSLVLMGEVIVLYVAAFSIWTNRIHDALGTFGFDLGIFDQGMWLLSRFKEPFITIMGVHLFGDHTSFILLPLVPLYWIAPSAKVLLVAQSAALGLAAFPLYLIGKEKLKNGWLALAVSVAYLAHPATAWANFEQFHPDVFMAPLVLTAIYLMLKHRWRWFLVTVVALLLVKENVPLLTLPLGLYVALKHNRKVGLFTMGLSIVWWSVNIWLVLPYLNGVGQTLDAVKIPFGGFSGLINTLLTRPSKVIAHLIGPEKPWYLWQLFAPFGLVALLAPLAVLIASGLLLLNLMVDWWYGYHIQYHYQTAIVPVLAAATVFGIARLKSRSARRVVTAWIVVSALASGYLWGPTPLARQPAPIGDPFSPAVVAIKRAAKLVPDTARVSAYYSYVPLLSHRTYIYEFPTPWRAANWSDGSKDGTELPEASEVEYIVLPADPTVFDEGARATLDRILPQFTTMHQDSYVRVLRRTTP